jgi:hypothetical protein
MHTPIHVAVDGDDPARGVCGGPPVPGTRPCIALGQPVKEAGPKRPQATNTARAR